MYSEKNKSLAYCSEDNYSIVALNGGTYIDDYTYNYYDHDMINRLHRIHEPYQGERLQKGDPYGSPFALVLFITT